MAAVRRERSDWLLAGPLMAAGSVLAHALAYRLAGQPAQAVAADDTHHYLAYLSPAAAPAAVLALLALTLRVVRASSGHASPPLSWRPFALIPPLAFGVQEHLERLAQTGRLPLGAALEPTFRVGLVLELVLGLAVFVATRTLLGSANRVAEAGAGTAAAWLPPRRALGVVAVPPTASPPTPTWRRPTSRAPPAAA